MIKKIMKPVFGTFEWAEHNENIVSGCIHNCLYCYSKEMAIRYKRKTSQSWKAEIINSVKIQKKAILKKGRIMFPSSHDITPSHVEEIVKYLEKLLAVGNDILIVSKPHLVCIKKLCDKLVPYKNRILFRFTIGSTNNRILKFWEPGAPSFQERKSALIYAHSKGFKTSVSIEPMLDTVDNTIDLTRQLMPYVTDAVWIGTPNLLRRRLKMNEALTKEAEKRLDEFLIWHSKNEICRLFQAFKLDPKVKWKESIKKVIGIAVPTCKGLDI